VRIAFRCDGGGRIGAGHVARCAPVAGAFRSAGYDVTFVGQFDGLARWLLERSSFPTAEPVAGAPAGLELSAWDGAVVDSYEIAEEEICTLAQVVPVATMGEARRCAERGVLIDYHLDRDVGESGDRLLAGAQFVPIDPRFADARRARDQVRTLLVTVGGSDAARRLVPVFVNEAAAVFPDARILVAGGECDGAESLPSPTALVDVVSEVDAAVSAAGLTAYELACAAVPAIVVAIVDNQRRVVRACESAGVAIALDATRDDSLEPVRAGLAQLADPVARDALRERGPAVVDGLGADRIASGLAGLWGLARR
jgi:spore coat polysaccharide biosynthesis predicted glycosyltransferase SpsG